MLLIILQIQGIVVERLPSGDQEAQARRTLKGISTKLESVIVLYITAPLFRQVNPSVQVPTQWACGTLMKDKVKQQLTPRRSDITGHSAHMDGPMQEILAGSPNLPSKPTD